MTRTTPRAALLYNLSAHWDIHLLSSIFYIFLLELLFSSPQLTCSATLVTLQTMPSHLGQKVLNKVGLGNLQSSHHNQSQQQHHHGQIPLPGRSIIHDDERNLSHAGTYPRIAPLSDGSILGSYTSFEGGGQRVLRVCKSTDGGHTFSNWGEVTRGSGDVDNMFLLEISPETVLAAFRNHDLGPGGGPKHFRITVCGSTDGGRHWRFLSQAAEKGAPMGLWEPFMRLGSRGEVMLTYSQEFAHDDQRTMLVISQDQGRSWTAPRCIEGEKERLRDGMNGIAATIDHGRPALVMVMETTRYGPFSVEGVVSYDDGFTWQHRHEVYAPPRGHNAGAPQIASFADGSLAVVFMTDEDSSTVDWVKHAAIKVVFSGPPQNGRLNWTKPMHISPGSSFWPGITAVDHDRVLVTYDKGGPRARSITWHPH